jgi:hypothetical protein
LGGEHPRVDGLGEGSKTVSRCNLVRTFGVARLQKGYKERETTGQCFFLDQRPWNKYAPNQKLDWLPVPSCATLFPDRSIHRSQEAVLENSKGMTAVSFTAVIVALLQSLCTAVLTINSVRLTIGLAALAAGSVWEPVRAFHRDSIRIPMLIAAVVGAVVNLLVLAWISHLRERPEAQWRRRVLSKKERWSERLQVALAVVTLVLVGAETWTHAVFHRHHHHPQTITAAAVKINFD